MRAEDRERGWVKEAERKGYLKEGSEMVEVGVRVQVVDRE